MCCCHRQNRCACGNNNASVWSAVSGLSARFEDDSTVNTRWPVYVSFPTYLWDTGEDENSNSGSCGCCNCCCRG